MGRVRTTYLTGATGYAYVRRRTDGKVWYPAGGVYEAFGTSGRTTANYKVITLAEDGDGSGDYSGEFPATITTPGFYDVHCRIQRDPDGDPANNDIQLGIQEYEIEDTAAIAAAAAAAAEETAAVGTDAAGLLVAVNNMILDLIQGKAQEVVAPDGRKFAYIDLPALRLMRKELQKEVRPSGSTIRLGDFS